MSDKYYWILEALASRWKLVFFYSFIQQNPRELRGASWPVGWQGFNDERAWAHGLVESQKTHSIQCVKANYGRHRPYGGREALVKGWDGKLSGETSMVQGCLDESGSRVSLPLWLYTDNTWSSWQFCIFPLWPFSLCKEWREKTIKWIRW